MTYSVRIRNNATNEIRVYKPSVEWDKSSHFWWTEGNFGCDCNRYLSFERAGGREPEDGEEKCGHTQFTAIDATLEDGTVIKLDEDKWP